MLQLRTERELTNFSRLLTRDRFITVFELAPYRLELGCGEIRWVAGIIEYMQEDYIALRLELLEMCSYWNLKQRCQDRAFVKNAFALKGQLIKLWFRYKTAVLLAAVWGVVFDGDMYLPPIPSLPTCFYR